MASTSFWGAVEAAASHELCDPTGRRIVSLRCGAGAAVSWLPFCALGSVFWERFSRMESFIFGFCFGRKALNAGASRQRLRAGSF